MDIILKWGAEEGENYEIKIEEDKYFPPLDHPENYEYIREHFGDAEGIANWIRPYEGIFLYAYYFRVDCVLGGNLSLCTNSDKIIEQKEARGIDLKDFSEWKKVEYKEEGIYIKGFRANTSYKIEIREKGSNIATRKEMLMTDTKENLESKIMDVFGRDIWGKVQSEV